MNVPYPLYPSYPVYRDAAIGAMAVLLIFSVVRVVSLARTRNPERAEWNYQRALVAFAVTSLLLTLFTENRFAFAVYTVIAAFICVRQLAVNVRQSYYAQNAYRDLFIQSVILTTAFWFLHGIFTTTNPWYALVLMLMSIPAFMSVVMGIYYFGVCVVRRFKQL